MYTHTQRKNSFAEVKFKILAKYRLAKNNVIVLLK